MFNNSTSPSDLAYPVKNLSFFEEKYLDYTRFKIDDTIILICESMGVCTSIINIIVFLNKKLRVNTIFKVLTVMSIADFFYLGLSHIKYISKLYCASNDMFKCLSKMKQIDHIFYLIVDQYITSCLAIFNIMIEIYLTIDRLLMVCNSHWLKKIKTKIMIEVIGGIAIFYYLPVFFLWTVVEEVYIVQETGQIASIYSQLPSPFGDSAAGKSIPITLSFIRVFNVTIVLLTLNVINIIKFRSYFAKKSNIKFKPTSKILIFLD
jgi:hypothetical protein